MYAQLISDIEGVFAGGAWTALSIPAYPNDYEGDIDDSSDFVRMSILPAKGKEFAHGGVKDLSGLLIVSIYVHAGDGPRQPASISDSLDTLFQYKTLTNGTQLKSSYLVDKGIDKKNEALYRWDYTITFHKYGE